jgi:hypothetical protein
MMATMGGLAVPITMRDDLAVNMMTDVSTEGILILNTTDLD